ncbi:MAG: formylmethanofuran dehydrogenase [Deltaproteobacteria bacterium]|nr:formylmethanofuran dehydrogenase [Deltaproteobacteria bacterium]
MNGLFEELLASAGRAHGHICPGQVLGVRMGILGLALLGFEAPLNDRNIKKVIIYVEIDRCLADALATVTGVKLGRRSLKFRDFGLMAATFVRLTDGLAYRIAVKEDCRTKATEVFPEIPNTYHREVAAYQVLAAAELFQVEQVRVELNPDDLPGANIPKLTCNNCGATIRHGRVVENAGRRLCHVCGGLAYFESIKKIGEFDHLDPSQTT